MTGDQRTSLKFAGIIIVWLLFFIFLKDIIRFALWVTG